MYAELKYKVGWAHNRSPVMNFVLEGKLCLTGTISTIKNFILEGKLKQTVMYTSPTTMNFILEGKLCFSQTNRFYLTVYTAQRRNAVRSFASFSDFSRNTIASVVG